MRHEANSLYKATKDLSKIRTNINDIFPSLYGEILKLVDEIGVDGNVLRRTILQRNRSNTPNSSSQEHYKRIVAIQHIDSLIIPLKERFNGES